ncbi:MAG TPA: hypothetical protein VH253_13360 [Phycisphaerae bacterium]|nr:hypothetical protein [Phycisphaerae bacterium]
MTNMDPRTPLEIAYAQALPHGNARILVLLAGIFTLVSGGLDFFYGCAMAFDAVIFSTVVASGPSSATMPAFMKWMWAGYAAVAALSLVYCGVKIFAGIMLLRKRRHARGLGLAVGIMGCTEFWCSLFCFIPLAFGVFTLVVMCLGNVANYLRDPNRDAFPEAVRWPSGGPPPGSGG